MKKKKIRKRSLGELMAGVATVATVAPLKPQVHTSQAATPNAAKAASQQSAPTEEKPKFKLPSLRKTPTFSVKGVINGKISAAAIHKVIEPIADEEETSTSDLLDEEKEFEELSEGVELTQRNLELTWEKFAAHIQKERPRLGHTLQAAKPTLINNTNIIFEVVNSYQKDEVMSIYNELTHFLKKSLEAPKLEIELIEAETDSTSAKPYTIEEKFKSMAAKNPAILTLKQLLGLDFE